MSKPVYANNINILANHETREAILVFISNVPTLDDDLFQITGSASNEVASLVVTESTLRKLHEAIHTSIKQLDDSAPKA